MAIFKGLTEHATFDDGAALGSELVNQAFSDERSLIYREARHSRPARQKVFLKAVFGEWRLVESAVRPLASWNVFRDNQITEEKIQRWGDALDIALGAFLDNREHGDAVFAIRQGLQTLNDVCTCVLTDREQRAAPWSAIQDAIYGISRIFAAVIKRIRASNLPAPVETTIEHYDPFQDQTVHGAIAEELFEFLGSVCKSSDHEFLDSSSIRPWMELFEEGELTTNLRALQVRLVYHVKLKLDDNLDRDRRFYPAITRLLLVRYALSAPGANQRSPMAGYLHE